MSKVVINCFEDFEPYAGKELGTSDYVQLTQERICQFADATLDHQWIHVDQEKAKAESPFGTTIAHRLILTPKAESQEVSAEAVLRQVLERVHAPKLR